MHVSRHWIIWLCLALLPLKGWAWASMAMVHLPSTVPQVAVAPQAHHAAAHCHGSDEGDMAQHLSDHTDQNTNCAAHHEASGSACQHCPLCHATVTPVALPAINAPRLGHASPQRPPRLAEGRARGCELLRPPQA